MATNDKKIKVVELFAGVGGFHIGLDRASRRSKKGKFTTVWASQWEPSSGKNQHAAWVYQNFIRKNKLKTVLSPENIWSIVGEGDEFSSRIKEVPQFDMLTGGFPCQDYSVARPLSQAAGLEGKKGVLWWSIYKLLHHQQVAMGRPAPYLFLENVDRLIKSPASRRGRDFAIMLSSLSQLGYIVEWRVINAAEYGFPQRRRRTFIVGYHKSSAIAKELLAKGKSFKEESLSDWVQKKGVLAKAFPVLSDGKAGTFSIGEDPYEITKNFLPEAITGLIDAKDPFKNSGIMVDLHVHTEKVLPKPLKSAVTLGEVIERTDESTVLEKYYIHPDKVAAWKEQKASHDFERTSKDGHVYRYKEGALPFPDILTRASRTIITSEGGSSPSRFKHVVDITGKKGYGKGRVIGDVVYRYRRLIPEELEELCMFDRGHTSTMLVPGKEELQEVSDNKRAFFMGNALVVGVIEKIGSELLKRM